jgi:hypothetical protein
MTRTKRALFATLTTGFGCSATLGTITSEGQPSSTNTTTATSVDPSTADDTTSAPTGSTGSGSTTEESGSTTGVSGSTTGAGESTTGESGSTTGAGESTTGESPVYPNCPACSESFQACTDNLECTSILEFGCADGDLACIAVAIGEHCAGADLFLALDACIKDNCGQPLCIAEDQACAATAECAALRDCQDECDSCASGDACRADCQAQASMAGVSVYNSWVQCILAQSSSPPWRAPQSSDRDYDGDGVEDVFWYAPGVDPERMSLGTTMKGSFDEAVAHDIVPSYSAVAGDFDGDGFADVYLYAPGLPDQILGGGIGGAFEVVTPKDRAGAYISIAGDFDGDGLDDLFWYAPGPGEDSVWYALGDHQFEEVVLSVDGNYLPVRGDFDGDGRDDIFWYALAEGPEAVWYGNQRAAPFETGTAPDVPPGYLPFSGNFDANVDCMECDDIFWYSFEAQQEFVWNGSAERNIGFIDNGPPKRNGESWNVSVYYKVVPGDFNGDGHTDIIWYKPEPKDDYIWYGLGDNNFDDAFPFTMDGSYLPV